MEFGNNYGEFIKRIIMAEAEALNSEQGKQYMENLLAKAKEDNPNLTPEGWSKIKQQFLVCLFAELLKDNPEFQKQFAHLWHQEVEAVATEENNGESTE